MDEEEMKSALLDVQRGRVAQQELYFCRVAFEDLRKAALDMIINSAPDEVMLRDRMIITCQILDAVKQSLEKVVDGGEAAQSVVDIINKQ